MDLTNPKSMAFGIRENNVVGESLKFDQKNTSKSYEEEEEKRMRKEIVRLNGLIQKNEELLKGKQDQLTILKNELEQANNQVEKVEFEVAVLEKELENEKRRLEKEQNWSEVEKLEKELQVLQAEEKKLTKDALKKIFEENLVEKYKKKKQIDISECSYDYENKVKEFEDYLRDLENSKVKPRQQRLSNMKECLAQLRAEWEELEKEIRSKEESRNKESGKGVGIL